MLLTTGPSGRRGRLGARGFTLIELLTVIAIISLLISILLPSLSKARDQAKATKTRAMLKALGDGLELFRNENPSEVKGDGYPSSQWRDDPTVPGKDTDRDKLSGAQWMVRYLMGKDLRGYVAFKNVPSNYKKGGQDFGGDGWEQKGWYEDPNIQRSGPYLDPGAVRVASPKDIEGFEDHQPPLDPNSAVGLAPVALDTFELPILYYAANARLASRPNARSAVVHYDPNDQGNQETKFPGIYTHSDNGLFTAACSDLACYNGNGWDLGGGVWNDKGPYFHPIYFFGRFKNGNPNEDPNELGRPENANCFVRYITSRSVYDATKDTTKTVVPHRADSFLLISAGKDARFGTADDVTNFER